MEHIKQEQKAPAKGGLRERQRDREKKERTCMWCANKKKNNGKGTHQVIESAMGWT